LDLENTFDSQKRLVNNTLIPIVKKSIDKVTFPVADGIIKHIIHKRHRHQRKKYLKETREEEWNDNEKRRKHFNTKRTYVSK